MEGGSTLGMVLTYVVLAIVLLAIAFGVTRAAWFFSMLVWMNLARKDDPADPGEPEPVDVPPAGRAEGRADSGD